MVRTVTYVNVQKLGSRHRRKQQTANGAPFILADLDGRPELRRDANLCA